MADINWKDKLTIDWRQEAKRQQQGCCSYFIRPMWREYEPKQHVDLKKDIGFALFGAPEELPHPNLNYDTGYTAGKLKEINKIFGIIQKCTEKNKNPNKICVAFLFVFGKTGDASIQIPVIRVQKFDEHFEQNNNVFIDSCGRVYKDWQDYLDNNTIPESVLCYPRNGVYSAVNAAVEVEFGISPAGRRGAKLLQNLDTVADCFDTVAKGYLTVAMFLPVALPFASG
jgi:hypothetical protein